MTTVQAVVKLPYTTGIPRDVSESAFIFDGTGTIDDIVAHWSDPLKAMYNSVNTPGTIELAGDMSNQIDRSNCKIQWRTLTIATGRLSELYFEDNWTMLGSSSTGSDYPAEVALCATYGAPQQPTPIIKRRRHGRVYFGPFNSGVGVGLPARPSAALRNRVAGAVTQLLLSGYTPPASTGEPGSGDWVLYSRASRQIMPIMGGYVDDEWDTQRRRGFDPTTRTFWS